MPVKFNPFSQLRAAHHKEKAEDYVEMILELVSEQGEARLTEVAKRFGVSIVTAHKIIARLKKEKWIETKPYRAIFLTPRGKRLANKSKNRHAIVYHFLKKMGVPEKTAKIDAEGIEHHVSKETLNIFRRHLK